jgi:hypothetical protein
MLYMRAADASHYTITDVTVFSLAIAFFKFQPAFLSLSARSLPGTSIYHVSTLRPFPETRFIPLHACLLINKS